MRLSALLVNSSGALSSQLRPLLGMFEKSYLDGSGAPPRGRTGRECVARLPLAGLTCNLLYWKTNQAVLLLQWLGYLAVILFYLCMWVCSAGNICLCFCGCVHMSEHVGVPVEPEVSVGPSSINLYLDFWDVFSHSTGGHLPSWAR